MEHQKKWASNSNYRFGRKTKRIAIRQRNGSELVNKEGHDDNFEMFDDENWDEIDATFLQSYRGRL